MKKSPITARMTRAPINHQSRYLKNSEHVCPIKLCHK